MRRMRFASLVLLIVAATSEVLTQTPASPSAAGPTFDVVSIKRNTSNTIGPPETQRPDGGLRMINVPVAVLISRAYPPAVPVEMVGLPAWAMSERYDVSATSSLSQATPADRTAMLRAMLADRFKLTVHLENRDRPVYDLVLARSDRRLGPGLKPSDADCEAADRAAAEAARNAGGPPPRREPPDFNAPPPPCTLRILMAVMRDRSGDKQGQLGDLMEGETTIASLVRALRMSAGREVVDKTGLAGSYRVRMNFDGATARRGPDTAPTADAPPSVFAAIQEQLGLKLESSRASRETLIIDRLERPTEN